MLSECAHVALVVDNRSALPGQLIDVEAVTATGHAHELSTRSEAGRWARLLTDRHPYLNTLVHAESCGLFRIDIVRYLHVTRFHDGRHWVPIHPA